MIKEVFKRSEYEYNLPQELVAQQPHPLRDKCRLLAVDREKSTLKEGIFTDIINLLDPGDALILNNTKVIRARLKGKKESGAKIEVLLLREKEKGIWEALVNPGKRARIGDKIIFKEIDFFAKILDKTAQGGRILQFSSPDDLNEFLEKEGEVPLPPYIKKDICDLDSYQTVYAEKSGAVAAPTAGLHFTPDLIKKINEKGISIAYVTLHCGLATFRPIKTEDIRDHKMESEWIEVSPLTADIVNTTKKKGGRIIAVGTTSIRVLETVADNSGFASIRSYCGETNLYIVPGYRFKVVDAVITNFHTPCSTNLTLISSFCGIKLAKKAYEYAINKGFRFYSFGDAMIII